MIDWLDISRMMYFYELSNEKVQFANIQCLYDVHLMLHPEDFTLLWVRIFRDNVKKIRFTDNFCKILESGNTLDELIVKLNFRLDILAYSEIILSEVYNKNGVIYFNAYLK